MTESGESVEISQRLRCLNYPILSKSAFFLVFRLKMLLFYAIKQFLCIKLLTVVLLNVL